MNRSTWDLFMIVLMGIVIFFCVQEIWRSPAPLSEIRCLFSMSIAVLVIILKAGALWKAAGK
jgi:hypothetical protein